MLRPSYSELMDAVMKEEELDPRVISRYTLVLAAAKRARQITDGVPPLSYAPTDRAVSIAVKELHEGKLKIRIESDLLDGNIERLLRQKDKYRAISALSKDDLREDLKDNYEPDEYDLYDTDDDTTEDLSFAAEEITTVELEDIYDEQLAVDDDLDVLDNELTDDIEEDFAEE